MDGELRYVMDAVRTIRRELDGRVPLIGFSGSPWTLACYMVEGQGSRDFARAKALAWNDPQAMHRLLDVLARSVAAYLSAQAEAGAQALMVFDTWGGLLSPSMFGQLSLRYLARVTEMLKVDAHAADLPVVLFSKGANAHLEALAGTGCDGLGLDWTIGLDEARRRVGERVALQGNLDPSVLYATPETIRARGRCRHRRLRPAPRARVQSRPRRHARRRSRARQGAGRRRASRPVGASAADGTRLGRGPRARTITDFSRISPRRVAGVRPSLPMDKSFEPAQIESKWYARWETDGCFKPTGSGDPYCILLPPPNVTGTLHMGHAFQQTVMDMLIRYHRMRGERHAVADRHRPCRHRHAEDRREPAGRRGHRQACAGPRGVRRAGVELEARVRLDHHQPDAPPGRGRRLVARALHHGRGPVGRGAQGVHRVVPRGPDLPRQPPGQLGSGAGHGGVRPGGQQRRARRPHVVDPLPGGRQRRDRDHRHHAPGDHARRRRRGRASRGRALRAPGRQDPGAAAGRAARSRSSPTTTSTASSAPAA